jgi:hypothetical protein
MVKCAQRGEGLIFGRSQVGRRGVLLTDTPVFAPPLSHAHRVLIEIHLGDDAIAFSRLVDST